MSFPNLPQSNLSRARSRKQFKCPKCGERIHSVQESLVHLKTKHPGLNWMDELCKYAAKGRDGRPQRLGMGEATREGPGPSNLGHAQHQLGREQHPIPEMPSTSEKKLRDAEHSKPRSQIESLFRSQLLPQTQQQQQQQAPPIQLEPLLHSQEKPKSQLELMLQQQQKPMSHLESLLQPQTKPQTNLELLLQAQKKSESQPQPTRTQTMGRLQAESSLQQPIIIREIQPASPPHDCNPQSHRYQPPSGSEQSYHREEQSHRCQPPSGSEQSYHREEQLQYTPETEMLSPRQPSPMETSQTVIAEKIPQSEVLMDAQNIRASIPEQVPRKFDTTSTEPETKTDNKYQQEAYNRYPPQPQQTQRPTQSQQPQQQPKSFKGKVSQPMEFIKLGGDRRRDTKSDVRQAIRRAKEFRGRPSKGPVAKPPPAHSGIKQAEQSKKLNTGSVDSDQTHKSNFLVTNSERRPSEPTINVRESGTYSPGVNSEPDKNPNPASDNSTMQITPSSDVPKVKVHKDDIIRILGPYPKHLKRDSEFEDMWNNFYPQRNQPYDPECLGDVIQAHSWASMWGRGYLHK